jgi:alkylhydroperoxidase family enzyme
MSQLDDNRSQQPLVPLLADDEFSPSYRETVERIRSRSGHISNSARATAHGEELAASTRSFLESTWLLGDLPKTFRALIRYKVSTVNTCFYCSSHQLGYLKRMGVDEAKIRHIHEFMEHPAFDERERAALAFAEAMTVDASNVPDAVAERFVAVFSPKERIEVAIVAAGMGMLNKLNDALRIPVEDSVMEIAAAVPDLGRAG